MLIKARNIRRYINLPATIEWSAFVYQGTHNAYVELVLGGHRIQINGTGKEARNLAEDTLAIIVAAYREGVDYIEIL